MLRPSLDIFSSQVSVPWPLITPPPSTTSLFRDLNSIQPIVGTLFGLEGASNFPLITMLGDEFLRQGPLNIIGPTRNVPLGIKSLAAPPCAQAASQASENAYQREILSNINMLAVLIAQRTLQCETHLCIVSLSVVVCSILEHVENLHPVTRHSHVHCQPNQAR